MARPERRDVDYFPFYVKDGKTLFILESKYGCKGTGFFTNVMRFLCKTPNHHFQIKDDADRMYFFSCCHCDEESGLDMLNVMAKTNKISDFMWINHKVIVSEALLASITDAYRNRKAVIISFDQIKVSYASNPGKGEITNAGNLITNVDNPQSKVKKSKVKRKPPNPPLPWPDDFVLTDHLRKLASKYIPSEEIEREWESFKAYSLSKGKTYVSWTDAWTTRYINYSKYNNGTRENKPGVWND